jgi:ketosteroid isomerase-like protein
MKFNKDQETEIIQVYKTYFDSYINGDTNTIADLLDDEYNQIGSADGEVFFNKKDALKFLHDTIDQVAGKTKIRNRELRVDLLEGFFLVTDLFDIYVLIDKNWTFYARFRASTLMQKKKDGWKFIHQHSSMPDMKTQEGENIAIEKISAENLQLRDAVKRRTIELEQRNRELEIEASLERVRAVSLSMKRPGDMLEVCRIISEQLELLGVENIRNVQTFIIYESKETYINYEYYRLHDKALVTEVDYNIHPVLSEFAHIMLKEPDAFFTKSFTGTELNEWIENQKNSKQFVDSFLEEVKSLNYYIFSTGQVALGISTYSPIAEEGLQIFKRFKNAFDLAYRRYNDITIAEAQAREAQIEAALERIRAQSMAMHQSHELSQVASLLYQQFLGLGLSQFVTCGFNIYDEKRGNQKAWITQSDGSLLESFDLPLDADTVFKERHQAWKRNESMFVQQITGKVLKHHVGLAIDESDSKRANEMAANFPDPLIFYNANFAQGYLSVISGEPLSQESQSVLVRFAKVFEQTYTRFLDLKKAEAQAREAQIEAALERVRTRTMAMQKTDELLEAAGLLYKELFNLGIPSLTSGYVLMDKDGKIGWNYDSSPEDGSIMSEPLGIPHKETKVMRSITASWKKQEPFHVIELNPQETIDHQTFIAERTPNFPYTTAELLSFSPERLVLHTFNFKEGYLLMINGEKLADHEIQMMIRFTRVFEMTYKRFLDLKKAEAQAREAQIEAALERVRARTMAMQSSRELSEAATVLFKQLREIGGVLWSTGFVLLDKNEEEGAFWMANPEGEIIPPIYIPNSVDPATKNMYINWKKGADYYVQEAGGEELKTHYEYLMSLPKSGHVFKAILDAGFPFPTWQQWHAAYFSHGYLLIITMEPFEDGDLLVRFAKVFEQTYTRFLDLQKAEAQAHEAQIEAALERVRARSMAMQKSNELIEVANTLREQMRLLGQPELESVMVIQYDEENFTEEDWFAFLPPKGKRRKILTGSVTWRLDENEVVKKLFKLYKSGIGESTFNVKGQDLKEILEDVKEKLPAMIEYYDGELPENIIHHVTRFSGGHLLMTSYEAPDEKSKDLQKRVTKTFDLAYKRFLDLKKAEEQARETEIQLALERIRARTMAMHNSEELAEIAAVLFTQLNELGVAPERMNIGIVKEDEKIIEFWSTEQGGKKINQAFKSSILEKTTLSKIFKAWKTGKKSMIIELTGRELSEWIHYLKQKIRMPFKEELIHDKRYHSTAFFTHGMILISTPEPLAAETLSLLPRFAKVFEQTYTRFLDLQKAEAQAREAQIEAALERVRSRSMGMQKSEELKEVIRVVYEQFIHLKINVDHAGFVVDYIPGGDWHFWIADKQQIPSKITHSYFDSVWANQFDEAKEKGIDFFTTNLNFEEKNKFYQDLFSYIPGLSEQSKEFYFNCPGLAASNVLLENVALYIENFSAIPYTDEENKILMRFGKVFQQTYTRFLDLQKAEVQAREAQIEAALERVRSRTMGMQRSDELQDAAMLLFQQVETLGVPVFGCGFNIWDDDRKAATAWMAGKDRLQPPFKTSSSEDIFLRIYEAAQRGESLFVEEQGGNALITHYTYMNSIPVFKGIADKMAKTGQSIPTFQIMHCAYFSQGYLMFITHEHASNTYEIFKRFATVFEQTYTRFLDLQKAEAQAREAQIETALERVRAQSMAMHKTEDLHQVLSTVFSQLQSLGVYAPGSALIIYDQDLAAEHWMIGFSGEFPESYKIPYVEHQYFTDLVYAWQKGVPFQEFFFEGDLKIEYAKWLLENSDFKRMPPEFKKEMLDPTRMVISDAFNKYGMIEVLGPESLSEEAVSILKRFSKVFEQAYTRFLDIQKAEAQAREAQIEAALERIRAQASAMHTSEDITKVALAVWEQLGGLNLADIEGCAIHILTYYGLDVWYAFPELSEGSEKLVFGKREHTHLPSFMKKIIKDSKKSSKEIFLRFSQNQIEEFYDYISPEFERLVEEFRIMNLKELYMFAVPFRNGFIASHVFKPLPQESINVIIRITSVFDMAYRRFEDLKKAEAQTREAEIQLALERVRARTMAMQKSDELKELVHTLSDELGKLDIIFNRTFIIIYDTNSLGSTWWMRNPESNESFGLYIKYHEHIPYQAHLKAWRERKTTWQYILEGKDKKDWDKFLFTETELSKLPDHVKNNMQGKEKVNLSSSFSNFGYLTLESSGALSDEQFDILSRFAKVFDLTYTRFLDIKKAEAQAREAQIEAALERVRAKSMAMHQSEELSEVALVLWEQLEQLNLVGLDGCAIHVNDDSAGTFETFIAFPDMVDGKKGMKLGRYKFKQNCISVLQEWDRFYRAGEKKFSVKADKTQLNEFIDWFEPTLPFLAKEMRKKNLDHLYVNGVAFSNGILGAPSFYPLVEETWMVFGRMADVFDLAYRRFQDLQKAEAQTREAQIEAALERVRARSMAMQNSEELNQLIGQIYLELSKLDMVLTRTSLLIVEPDKKSTRWWMANSETPSKPMNFFVKYHTHPPYLAWLKAWQNREQKWVYHLKGKVKKEWDEYIFSETELSKLPDKVIQGMMEPDHVILTASFGNFGALEPASLEPLSDEQIDILIRFTKVFEQTYTRFLDLQKAEAQAREAQIEASLERIRARAMAMQKSDELREVVGLVSE